MLTHRPLEPALDNASEGITVSCHLFFLRSHTFYDFSPGVQAGRCRDCLDWPISVSLPLVRGASIRLSSVLDIKQEGGGYE